MAARARVSRLTLTAVTSTTLRRARVSQLVMVGEATTENPTRARISQLAVTGFFTSKRARISLLRFTGSNTQGLVASLVATPAVAEPGETVTLSAAGTTGRSVVTAWEITAGGSGVALSGSGLVQTLVAPRDYQGRTITVQVGYLAEFGASDTRTVDIVVRPQQWWFCKASGVLVPVTYPLLRV